MLTFFNATIDCDKETAKVYEYKFGEDDPLEFPLSGVQITQFGGRIVVQIPTPGAPAKVIDRLKGSEPTQQTSKGKTVYSVSGGSEHLYMQGVDPEHATVQFTITEWEAGAGSVVE